MFLFISGTLSAKEANKETIDKAKQLMSNTGVLFIENKGQIKDSDGKSRPDVLYLSSINGNTVYFLKDRICFTLRSIEKEATNEVNTEQEKSETQIKLFRFDIQFIASNPQTKLLAEDMQTTKYNFFKGNSQSPITNVRTFKKLTYKDLYPNVDIIFHDSPIGLKYDLIIKPGGNISAVLMNYIGVSELELLNPQKIQFKTPFGTLGEEIPNSYQITNVSGESTIKPLDCRYTIIGNTLGFAIGEYDKNNIIVIDPSLLSASYIGGQIMK